MIADTCPDRSRGHFRASLETRDSPFAFLYANPGSFELTGGDQNQCRRRRAEAMASGVGIIGCPDDPTLLINMFFD
jgi:hypothetical protein